MADGQIGEWVRCSDIASSPASVCKIQHITSRCGHRDGDADCRQALIKRVGNTVVISSSLDSQRLLAPVSSAVRMLLLAAVSVVC